LVKAGPASNVVSIVPASASMWVKRMDRVVAAPGGGNLPSITCQKYACLSTRSFRFGQGADAADAGTPTDGAVTGGATDAAVAGAATDAAAGGGAGSTTPGPSGSSVTPKAQGTTVFRAPIAGPTKRKIVLTDTSDEKVDPRAPAMRPRRCDGRRDSGWIGGSVIA